MIPLYGFAEGDTIGLIVLAQPDETIAEIGERLLRSASVRVKPKTAFKVVFAGKDLDPRLLVRESGLTALDRFEVVGRRS